MTDTSMQSELVRIAALRAMTPARRLSIASNWTASMREMMRAGLRKKMRDTQAAQADQRRLFAEQWLGPDLALRAYGPLKPHG